MIRPTGYRRLLHVWGSSAPAPRDSEFCLPLQLPLVINSSSTTSSNSLWRYQLMTGRVGSYRGYRFHFRFHHTPPAVCVLRCFIVGIGFEGFGAAHMLCDSNCDYENEHELRGRVEDKLLFVLKPDRSCARSLSMSAIAVSTACGSASRSSRRPCTSADLSFWPFRTRCSGDSAITTVED